MNRGDILAGGGAVISTIVFVLGSLWSIGALQIVFSVFGTACATLLIQSRLQDRQEKKDALKEHEKEMREHIYGPLLMHINGAIKDLDPRTSELYNVYNDVPPLWLSGIQETMKDYHFFLASPIICSMVEELHGIFQNYITLERNSKAIARQTENEVATAMLDVNRRGDPTIMYRLTAGGVFVEAMSLSEALMRNATPIYMLHVKSQQLKDVEIEALLGGFHADIETVNQRCEEALRKVRQHPTFQLRSGEEEKAIMMASIASEQILEYIKQKTACQNSGNRNGK